MHSFPARDLPDPFDPTTDHLRSSSVPHTRHPRVAATRLDQAAEDDDLQRLESSVQWLMRQGPIVRVEAAVAGVTISPNPFDIPSGLGA